MKLTEEQKELYVIMLPIYGAMLNQKQASELTNKSPMTLSRMRANGIGIPFIKEDGKSKQGNGARIFYPLQEVVKYLTENQVKTL